MRTPLTIIAFVFAAPSAMGQSFNIDLDIGGGPPEIGNGVPSDTFGAAAGQPGRWNRIPVVAGTLNPVPLVNLEGSPTEVTYRLFTNNSAGGGGFFFPGNTGAFALLLNDVRQIGPQVQGGRNTFKFSGLTPGPNDILTYAVSPVVGVPNEPVPVTVLEAAFNQTQIVMGPMPGNSFEYLLTHSIHRVILHAGGDIHVDIIQPPGLQNAYFVNGFQIVLVPEPATWIAILTFSAALCRKTAKEVS